MRTFIFADLKQVYIIQEEFLCETVFQRTLVKNNLLKSSQPR